MKLLLDICELEDFSITILIIPERERLIMLGFFQPEIQPILPAAIWS